MNLILKLIEAMPPSVRLLFIGLLLGGACFAGAESRYMTVADFTKSYILDLKGEIRQIRYELQNPELSQEHRHLLEEQLEELIDELCLETGHKDPYCASIPE